MKGLVLQRIEGGIGVLLFAEREREREKDIPPQAPHKA